VEVAYQSGEILRSSQASTPLHRNRGFAGRLPFDGIWYVAAEHGFLDAHKRLQSEMFAYDFLQIGAGGRSHQKEGTQNADYYAYGKKVLASGNGTVVWVRSDIAENVPGNPNDNTPGGNAVVIDHGNRQYTYYAHLRPFTTVKNGTRVKAGDPIGEVGNSGDSLEPHLHFHAMNHPDIAQAVAVQAVFSNWKAQSYGRRPVVRELGIVPRGEFVSP
jgi:murein DD-endopeptidase MepM/ murein hydrolase activator NlpD